MSRDCFVLLILAPSETSSGPDGVKVHRMVAIFDYDPWESSPNMDIEVNAFHNKYVQSAKKVN